MNKPEIRSWVEGGRILSCVEYCPVDFEGFCLVLRRVLDREGTKTKIQSAGSDWEICAEGEKEFSVLCQQVSSEAFLFHPFFMKSGEKEVCDSEFRVFLDQALDQVTKYHSEPAVEMAITDDLILDALEIANDPMALEILDIANGYLTEAGRTSCEKL